MRTFVYAVFACVCLRKMECRIFRRQLIKSYNRAGGTL